MRYCKAYLLKDLAKFPNWSDITKPKAQDLSDEEVVYLIESFQVTTNPLAMDQEDDYLLNDVTPEWEDFCKTTLKFEVPNWEEESKAVRAAIAEADKA